MNWAAIIGKITGTVDRHLLDHNAYLLAENRLLRSRVAAKIRFTDPERIALAKAAKPLGRAALRQIATLVTPDVLLRWHRRLVEKTTTAVKNNVGRPPTEEVVVQLVLQMADENPAWGYDRIAGELAKLGIAISDSTVGNILRRHATPIAPERRRGKSWKEFIDQHRQVMAGCDFFTKEVWTLLGPVTIYVLFCVNLATRKVHIAGCTQHPNQAWMKQVARNLTMEDGPLAGLQYIILDRDAKFCESFREILKSGGVEPLRIPPRSPNLNAHAERFVRSIKEECLDHLILFGDASLRRACSLYLEHYHADRPHQGVGNVPLFPSQPPPDHGPAGKIGCHKVLGSLLKSYCRKAA